MAVAWLVPFSSAESLRHLPDAEEPRFAITDRVWPSEVGAAHVCLWPDDKLAAVSVTIDDNCAPDHGYWLEWGEKTGYRFTWFVISSAVGTAGSFVGEWSDFQRLLDAGHDVQSHTVTHLNPKRGFEGDLEADYHDSVTQIEAGLPGHRVLAVAYPGGKNRDLNDPQLAGKYFIAGRGVSGRINPANKTDYLSTKSISGFNLGEPRWSDLYSILDPDSRNYRGWYSCHFHLVKPEHRETIAAGFAWMQEHDADVWVGPWLFAARYGQQRDTAELQTDFTDGSVTLTLTDRMDDALFNAPLTIKVRVPDAWSAARLVQAGETADLETFEHEGGRYVLAHVVPDAGPAELTPAN